MQMKKILATALTAVFIGSLLAAAAVAAPLFNNPVIISPIEPNFLIYIILLTLLFVGSIIDLFVRSLGPWSFLTSSIGIVGGTIAVLALVGVIG